MEFEINDKLLIDYLKGNLDEEQRKAVTEWYEASPQNQKELENLYFTLFVSDRLAVMERINVEKSLQDLKARIRAKENELIEESERWWKGAYLKKAIIAAAILAGVIFAGGNTLKHMISSMNQSFMVCTAQGERTKVLLPDGTMVWLNACSQVKYSSSLFSSERKVDMEGEAYFEVKKDKHAPFVVNSCGVSTRVLGTKFNIRANKEEEEVVATLLEGSILIKASEPKGQEAKMIPNQQMRVNKNTGDMKLANVDDSSAAIWWMEGKLHFEKETFANMATTFEKQFNVNIVFMDEKIKQERFTCDLETKDNIYQILSILRLTNKFNYEIKDRKILIYSIK
ncbi:FecR domain-containing protein [Bacteroides sedimenti]|uniref:Anti-sigma factor n=1 Tax=Bacteroides sedimenti TaxID=2136147 RepID=A0ABM8I750_9BACE